MLAIYSNNYFTDQIINFCKFDCNFQIFRSVEDFKNAKATTRFAFINHLNQYQPVKDDMLFDGLAFSNEIAQLKTFSDVVFAFDNEFHRYHFDILKIHPQSNIFWILPGHFNADICGDQSNMLSWDVQFDYQQEPYKQHLFSRLQQLQYGNEKPYFFDALLGFERPWRDLVFQWVKSSAEKSKIFMTYGKSNQSQYHWESDIVFLKDSFKSSADRVRYHGVETRLSLIVPIAIYNRCAYSIVAETNAFNEFSFFTEKIARPLLAKRLFVVFSGYGYLRNLRALGFQTFDNVIDESYDTIKDDHQRWQAAFNQVQRLCNMDQSFVHAQVQSRIEHNFELFYHTNWNHAMFQQVKNIACKLTNK